MNKTELVAAMADQAGLSKKDAEAALKAFTDVVATSNVPKPTNCTFPSFFNSAATTSVNAFNAASASFFDKPA